MSAVGNLSKTPIDALKGFDDHPEDPQHENIKDPPNGYYGDKVRGNEFCHGHDLAASIYLRHSRHKGVSEGG
jgi:hypothetical protein